MCWVGVHGAWGCLRVRLRTGTLVGSGGVVGIEWGDERMQEGRL